MQHQLDEGQLTPEEFYQHQSIPQSERPLTGAEGGRVGMKPGGLVEPGVTHYGQYTDTEAAEIYGDFLKGKKWSEMSKQEKISARDKRYWEENKEKIKKRSKEYHKGYYDPIPKTPLQIKAAEQLEWISKNAKNYSNPKLLQEKFMTHFKIKNLEKAAIFENAMIGSGKSGVRSVVVTDVPNIKGVPMGKSSVFNFTAGGTEHNLFRVATLQNNKKAAKELSESFKVIHDNFGKIRKQIRSDKLTFEEAVELLDKKNKVLKNWSLTFRSPGVWGGVGHGTLRQSLIEAGVPEEHLVSYSLVRRPLLIVDDIVQSLSRPGGGEEWGLNKVEALQTQKGWEKIKQGQTQASG
jgi:hypothetical protein